MEPLHRRVLQFIRRQRLLKDADSVVVGLSGGPDSVALVLILLDLAEGGKLALSVHPAHLNHGLRGAESDAEEGFCRQFARRHGLELEVARAAVADARGQGESIEAAARRIRYEFLGRVERELIRRALAQAKGNKAKAARLLGMTRPRLYRRLVQLGLEEGGP